MHPTATIAAAANALLRLVARLARDCSCAWFWLSDLFHFADRGRGLRFKKLDANFEKTRGTSNDVIPCGMNLKFLNELVAIAAGASNSPRQAASKPTPETCRYPQAI
jgi:hypothetical protein